MMEVDEEKLAQWKAQKRMGPDKLFGMSEMEWREYVLWHQETTRNELESIKMSRVELSEGNDVSGLKREINETTK